MASSSNKGAAEEPEPEPGPPSSSPSAAAAAPAPYDPREYQPAHPDDRGGDGKPAKKGGGAKGADKGEGENGKEGKGKADEDDGDATHRCGNCDAPDAKSKCKGCGVEYYCGRECQTVRLGRVRTCLGGTRAGGGRSKRRRSGVPSKRRRSRLADTS